MTKPGNRRRRPVPDHGAPRYFTDTAAVLDAQGISLLSEPDHHPRKRELVSAIKAYEQAGYVTGISVLTIAEERRTGEAGKRLAWWHSQLVKIPVTHQIASEAGALLDATGLSGHRSVVDAIVVATAASAPGQARVVSSDSSHVPALAKAAAERRGVPVEFKKV